jgi:3',5'-cyclic AMP phosphodiesterase CpdA
MKLIQISDMHIKKDTDIDSQMIIIDKMVESLKDDIVDKEDIVFCVLGDIIEKGDEKAFPNAKKIIKKIRTSFKSKFPKSRLYFEFVPGNHDRVGCDNLDEDNKKKKLSRPLTVKKVCAFDKFDEFINDIQKSDCKYSSKNYFTSKYDNIDLLLLNSAIENCKNGKIDLNAFKRKFEKPTLILAHHALMSMYDSDGSAIRNGITVLEKIRENNVIAMLHGHAHGFVYTDFGLTCKCIGVGPFLKVDNLPDVYRQFNFFNIQGSSILEVKNFIYRSDGGGKFFPYDKSLHPHQNNNFSGSSIKEIYDHVVTATNDMRIIRNLRIHLNCEYDVFKKDIKKHFKKDIKKAEDWQASELKPEWYFNHGERMR